ncbi:MAG: hypothetical protein ABI175_14360, partial [Polyangiales bacterium]
MRSSTSGVAVFTGAAAFALATFAPPGGLEEAHATGSGGNYGLEGLAYVAGAVALTLLAVDVGFAAHDIYRASNRQRVSDGMAVAELLVMVPQSILFFTLAATENNQSKTMWLGIGMVPTIM